ncbi:MAG: N-Acetyl-D-glucosamine ABC transport system, permease protein 1 [Candidatus Kapaibacterium sp.]|nr:MAG: N-Acetyl-D-glucosamine ABC transport system, permease protein 1 [Candidatus Kapabacteria bacterium]
MNWNRKDYFNNILLLSPWLIIFTIFWLYPLIYAFYLSLCDYQTLTSKTRFIGFENYKRVFADPLFWKALKNTAIFTFVTVPITTAISLFLANLLNSKFVKFKNFFQSAFFVPSITSLVVISIIFVNLYSSEGYINNLLRFLHLPYPKLGWLQDERTALPAIMIMDIWMSVGYYMILFLASMQSIPKEYYEVAELYSANGWQKFWKITFPSIRPMFLFVIVLNSIKSFQIFVEIYVMTRGGPLHSTTTLVYLIYENAFVKIDQMGYASAITFVVFFLLVSLSILQIKLLKVK